MDQNEFDQDNLSASQKEKRETHKQHQRYGYEHPVRKLFDEDRQRSHKSGLDYEEQEDE